MEFVHRKFSAVFEYVIRRCSQRTGLQGPPAGSSTFGTESKESNPGLTPAGACDQTDFARTETVSSTETSAYQNSISSSSTFTPSKPDHHVEQTERCVQPWKPAFLRRPTLVGFLICFLLQFIALVALFVFSIRNNGIVPVAAKYHQAWKYGPNAILAITIAFWTQVDLRAKQLVVWSSFVSNIHANNDASSMNTEYLSKINIVALFLSFRRRHWVVMLSTFGTILLQVAAIFSTSLLERVTQPISYELDSLRTAAVFSTGTVDAPYFSSVANGVLDIATAIHDGTDFVYPFGTTKSFAFEPPALPVIKGEDEAFRVPGSKSYITTRVQYIKPSISCKTVFPRFDFQIPLQEGTQLLPFHDDTRTLTMSANITNSSVVLAGGYEYPRMYLDGNLTITSGNLTLHNMEIFWQWGISPEAPNVAVGHCGDANIGLYAKNCGSDGNGTLVNPGSNGPLQNHCAPDRALLMVYSLCKAINPSTEKVNMTLTLLECLPDNEGGEATLKLENVGGGLLPEVLELSQEEIKDEKVFRGDLLFSTLANLGPRFSPWTRNDCAWSPNNTFDCQARHDNGSKKLSWPNQVLETYYSFFAVQILRSRWVAPGSRLLPGRMETEISRLVVTVVAFWSVATVLGVVWLCSLLLLSITGRKTEYLRRDPSTLGSSLSLLQALCRKEPVLQDVQSSRERNFNHSQPVRGAQRWWGPWGTTSVSIWFTIGCLIASLATLEVTLILSGNSRGLLLVNTASWSYYGWTLVPTFVVAVLSLMVSSVDFNIRVMAPFLRLTRNDCNSAGALLEEYIFGLLPSRLWSLARAGSVGLIAVTLGSMIMPFSIVFVGGLFVASTEPSTDPRFPLLQLDGFSEAMVAKLNWSIDAPANSWGPETGFPSIDLVPLPAFATETFAMGRFRVPSNDAPDLITEKSLSLKATATRGRLNCTMIESQCVNTQRPSFFNRSAPIPCNQRTLIIPTQQIERKGCSATILSPSIVDTYCNEPQTASLNMPGAPVTSTTREFVEYFLTHNMTILSNSKSRRWQFRPITNTSYYSNQDDCPQLMEFGEEVVGDCDGSRIGFAICDPYLESREADIMFSIPSFNILNVTTGTGLSIGDNAADNFAEKPRQSHIYGMARYLVPWAGDTTEANPGWRLPLTQDDQLDPVFRAILEADGSEMDGTSQHPVSLETLLRGSTDLESREALMSVVETRWSKAIARILRGYEKPFEEYDPPRKVDATLMNYERRWLVQSSASTRILQAILGWTALCLIAARFVFGRGGGRMDRVLFEPPTSVGALYRLVEGSKLMNTQLDKEIDGARCLTCDSKYLDVEGATGQRKRGVIDVAARRLQTSNSESSSVAKKSRWQTRIFHFFTRAKSKEELELRRIFDVPGRAYRLKEWDVVDAAANPPDEKGLIFCNNDGGKGKAAVEKRYGIDFEDVKGE